MSVVSYESTDEDNKGQAINFICYKSGSELGLSMAQFPKAVLSTVECLQKEGYQSYVVGGSLRDILFGKKPKDFDIVTSARPEEIRSIFRHCRIIGRRFRLAHVYQYGQRLEVATFRAEQQVTNHQSFSARHQRTVRDNIYGSLEQDIIRRDFSINAIYYDPFADQLVCLQETLPDIKDGYLRIIGDPALRYREDPVRILRALRFVAKLDLQISPETEQQIIPHCVLLQDVAPARLFDECSKLFSSGVSLKIYQLLKQYRLLEVLFPQTAEALKRGATATAFNLFLCKLFENTDKRIAISAPITPAFVLAGLWWSVTQYKIERLGRKRSYSSKLTQVLDEIVLVQRQRIAVPARLLGIIYQIFMLQPYFISYRRKEICKLLEHRRFRAAYDFFCLLSQAELADPTICQWWGQLQQTAGKRRTEMIQDKVKQIKAGRSSKLNR